MFKARLLFIWDACRFSSLLGTYIFLFLLNLINCILVLVVRWGPNAINLIIMLIIFSCMAFQFLLMLFSYGQKTGRDKLFSKYWIGNEIIAFKYTEYKEYKEYVISLEKFSKETGIKCYVTTIHPINIHFLTLEDRALWELTRES
jgi:hypothetical protein